MKRLWNDFETILKRLEKILKRFDTIVKILFVIRCKSLWSYWNEFWNDVELIKNQLNLYINVKLLFLFLLFNTTSTSSTTSFIVNIVKQFFKTKNKQFFLKLTISFKMENNSETYETDCSTVILKRNIITKRKLNNFIEVWIYFKFSTRHRCFVLVFLFRLSFRNLDNAKRNGVPFFNFLCSFFFCF